MAQDALIRIRAKVSGQREVKNLERQFKQTETRTKSLKTAFAGLSGTVARLGVAFAAFQGLKFSVIKAAELETQTRSLQVLTGSLESAKGIITELQQFAAVTPFTSSELIETSKRLKAFGVETSSLVKTVQRLGDVAGATGADLGGIATAFGQIVAKGRLQGEELLQLQERGVALAEVLKEEYNLTGEEFSKALEKGQISAEAVQFALERLTEVGGKYADGAISQSDTLAGKFSTLQDNIQKIARSIGKALTPALSDVLDILNKLISRLSDVNVGFSTLQNAAANAAISLGFESQGLDQLQSAISAIDLSFVDSEQSASKAQAAIDRISTSLRRLTSDPQAVERQYPQIKSLIKQLGSLRGTLKAVRDEGFAGTGAAQRERPDLGLGVDTETAKAIKDITQEQYEIGLQIIEAERKGQDFKVIELQLTQNFLALEQRKLGQRETLLRQSQLVLASEKEIEKTARAAGKAMADMLIEDQNKIDLLKKGIEDFNKSLADMLPAITPIDQLFKDIGQSITTNIAGAIEATIFQTQTLQESLSGILRSVASLLINFGTKSLLGGLFPSAYGNVVDQNKIVPFARGGLVDKPTLFPMANGMGLMGEAGPEAIMPLRRDASGRLGVEASGGGTSIVVNVDAQGTSVQGDEGKSRQLGSAISTAVQAELIKQQRPGGLLAR